jgi:RNA polymerase sigma-70 factor, ECF subfamily
LSETIDATATPVRLTYEDARELFQPAVFAFVSRRIKPVEDAEDLTAQIFLDAYRGWRTLRGSPKLWLFGIARRKVADAFRRRRRHLSLREEDLGADGMSEFVDAAQAREAYRIVMALPDVERDIILMQVLEEMPVHDISVVIGRSRKATNSLLQRARARIRKMTANQNGGSE